MHIAGNDFKTLKGSRVRPWIDESFWHEFKRKMTILRDETMGVFLVIWGDYQCWAPGFNDEVRASAAERYNGMCAEMLRRAQQLNIPSRLLRSEDLAALEHLPNDAWHFANSSASMLQELLNDMLDPRFFSLPVTSGVQYGEPPPPPPPPGSPLTEEPPAEGPTPVPRPTSKLAAVWELLAPLPARSERRMPDAYTPAPCDASGNLAQSAPTAKVRRIDAEVQTEPLPVLVDASAQARPVPPEHAMAMPGFPRADSAMTWYSTTPRKARMI